MHPVAPSAPAPRSYATPRTPAQTTGAVLGWLTVALSGLGLLGGIVLLVLGIAWYRADLAHNAAGKYAGLGGAISAGAGGVLALVSAPVLACSLVLAFLIQQRRLGAMAVFAALSWIPLAWHGLGVIGDLIGKHSSGLLALGLVALLVPIPAVATWCTATWDRGGAP